ncbi:hypothetical protein CSC62_14005 [Pseudoxanthomonas jiangsuensis]|uniref:putative holin n=1 Tax=Pseudoxanthomonas jiangsuensis TaxID=619688 RepID=UPI0013918A07|nr:putative holin [Pseudoxanthomonas jiangsuensis]KAF1692744.1 hypothetical protein CSC62_14005 [Pseudoxanthomonas jiangsuensis]
MRDRFLRLATSVTSLLDRIGYMWLWLLVSLLLLMLVAPINPVLLASYTWAASKMLMAGAVGYGVDWAAFRGGDPRYLQGIEQSMAQSRRGILIAAAMIAAGLIG